MPVIGGVHVEIPGEIWFEDGLWWVNHDHVSTWIPKEQWLVETLGASADGKWRSRSSEFSGKSMSKLVKALRWGFVDEHDAFMFKLKFY